MKHFKKELVRYILILELILLFSIFSSLLISKFMAENSIEKKDDHQNLFKNYDILKEFLNYSPESRENQADISQSNERLILNINKLKTADLLLKERKYKKLQAVIENIDSRSEYMITKKKELNLKNTFFQNKFEKFIKEFQTCQFDNIELKVFYIKSFLGRQNSLKATELFKELFLNQKFTNIKNMFSHYELNSLLKNIELAWWIKKLQKIENDSNQKEILSLKRYIKNNQLLNLFTAQYYYHKKRYHTAKKILVRVNQKELLIYKKKILTKINLRLIGEEDELLSDLDELKTDEQAYAKTLLDTAKIVLSKERINLANKLLSIYLNLNNSEDRQYWEALWLAAWINYKKNNRSIAINYFRRGLQSPITAFKIANEYWLKKMEYKNFKFLLNYPYTYYFTSLFQNKTVTKISLKNFIRLFNRESSESFAAIIQDLKLLLNHDLINDFFYFINWAKKSKTLNQTDKNMLKIIESIIHFKQQNYYKAFITFRDNFPYHQSIILPKFLGKIYFPVKFVHLIKKYSQLNGIDPNLVMALIREESFFNPRAVSVKNALGLMQILLPTARIVSSQKNKTRLSKRDLFKPDINLKLSTKFLKRLLTKYQGKLIYSLAAYNAGTSRVDSWLRQFGRVNDEVFVELIPFTSTRNYVKNVIRNHYYYKYYYSF